MNTSMAAGIALFGVGAILLGTTIPLLMTNPDFLGYSYLDANSQEINILVQLLALGSMLVPFGIIFLSKGRKLGGSKLLKDNGVK
jgi:hypothetical protein